MHIKLESFLTESHTDLENSVPGKSLFIHRNETFGLTGYFYVYKLPNENIYIPVEKEEATHVCGSYSGSEFVPINSVVWSDKTSNWPQERIDALNKSNRRRIDEAHDKYVFVKGLPLGLTNEEYEERIIDWIIDGI